jgi:hypothetical protein
MLGCQPKTESALGIAHGQIEDMARLAKAAKTHGLRRKKVDRRLSGTDDEIALEQKGERRDGSFEASGRPRGRGPGSFVTRKRDESEALRVMKKSLKSNGPPEKGVSHGLCPYPAAKLAARPPWPSDRLARCPGLSATCFASTC